LTKKRYSCSCCGKEKSELDFYASHSYTNTYTKKLSACKKCIWEFVVTDENGYNLESMKDVLQMIDKPFLHLLLNSSIEESDRDGSNVFKKYMKNIGMRQYRYLRWRDGDASINEAKKSEKIEEIEIVNKIDPTLDDSKNKEDVLKMLSYDPFESENKADKVYLYNRLVDFLDESTLEDSFKLPAVIEIVKSFNQIDKINLAISRITSDAVSVSSNVGSVNSLITAKEKMLKSVLALAKDNGISVNHNNNKSKGGGTLSGMIKQLQEKGFEESDVNLFDIETSDGMLQVANISNESIMKQLQFDENDYTNMLMDQREMLENFDKKIIDLEEENRKLKKQLIKISHGDEVGDVDG